MLLLYMVNAVIVYGECCYCIRRMLLLYMVNAVIVYGEYCYCIWRMLLLYTENAVTFLYSTMSCVQSRAHTTAFFMPG